jgi:hypothetical protein
MPPQAKQEVYRFLDKVGNLRIDRIAFGYRTTPGELAPGQRPQERIYLRITGQGDARRLIDFIRREMPEAKVEETKGPQGEAVTLLSGARPPAIAFIGDTEMVVAGPGGDEAGVALEILQQVLEIRAGKKPSVVQGPFAEALRGSPTNGQGLLMGALPEGLRQELQRSPFGAAPQSIALDLLPGKAGDGFEVRFRGTMAKADEAKQFAAAARKLIDQGVAQLDQLPNDFKKPVKPETIQALKKMLQSIEIAADGPGVAGRLAVTAETLQAVSDLVNQLLAGL